MDMNSIIPTRGKILCEILSGTTKTPGGLFIAKSLKEIPHRAKVLKVGGPVRRTCRNCDIFGCNSNEMQKKWKWYKYRLSCAKRGKPMYPCCEVGDTVHFKERYGKPWRPEKDEEEFIFLMNQEIIAIQRGC